MLRGKNIFRCTKCHKVFFILDIEWQATRFSTPVPCPKCGSKNTLPLLASKGEYERIWETMVKGK